MTILLPYSWIFSFIQLFMLNRTLMDTHIASPATHSTSTQAPLQYLIRDTPHTAPAPLIILLHGYGSNAHDLFALEPQVPQDWIVVAAQGPLSIGHGRHAWYDVGMVDGNIRINPEQADKSRNAVLQLIQHLQSNHLIDPHRIIVAGFSQGANLAQTVALSSPHTVAGFAVFSGRWVEELAYLIAPESTLGHTRAFIAHGSQDQMLPILYAQQNISHLQAMGLQVTFSQDSTQHTISPKQLAALIQWLQ